MGDLRRALASFAKVYGITVLLIGLIAFAVARVAKQDFIAFYQLLLVLMGIGYVFASVLAWTGFANIYRYSPTLYIGAHSYRQSIIRRDMAEEGRDEEALVLGILFGASLVGSGVALFGWLFALGVIAAAAAVVLYLRSLESANPKAA